MSQLISKLKLVAKYSNGIFISGQMASDKNERNHLYILSRRRPHFFNIIHSKNTKILQLTQDFNDYYCLIKRTSLIQEFNYKEIIQKIIWSSLILDKNIDFEFCKNPFKIGSYKFIIDTFENKFNYQNKILNGILFDGVITIEDRVDYFKKLNLWSYVPKSLKKSWVNAHLSAIFEFNLTTLNSAPTDISNHQQLLKDGFWPLNKHECHLDRKKYPGHKNLITGIEKWEFDKMILKKGIDIPNDYFLGVYYN